MASLSRPTLLRICNQSQNVGKAIEPHDIRALSYEELKKYTDGFSDKNLIGRFQFGKVYHGIVESDWARMGAGGRPVTVKIWEVPYCYHYVKGDNAMRMVDEFVLLRHQKLACLPGMMKLYGYCCEGENIGVVYDFESKDTVQNLIIKGGFTWLDRVKVALRFAKLLVFLHAENYQNGPFVIRNIEPSHIMVDKDYNPKLYDFGLIAGGIFAHERGHNERIPGCRGSIDHSSTGRFCPWTDVYCFGVLLMKLMYDEVDRVEEIENGEVTSWVYERVLDEYHGVDGSEWSMIDTRLMVAACLQNDGTFFPEDGIDMSKLAYDCTDDDIEDRPTMEEVFRRLLELQIVKKYHDKLGIEQLLK